MSAGKRRIIEEQEDQRLSEVIVVKNFADDREMMRWVTSSAIDELKKEYPESEWTGHIDFIGRCITVKRKEQQ